MFRCGQDQQQQDHRQDAARGVPLHMPQEGVQPSSAEEVLQTAPQKANTAKAVNTRRRQL